MDRRTFVGSVAGLMMTGSAAHVGAQASPPSPESGPVADLDISRFGGMTDAYMIFGDGTNQTTALRTALDAATASTTIKTVRIHGQVLIDVMPQGSPDMLWVDDDVTLEGVGYSSCIKYRPKSFVAGNNWGIRHRARAVIRWLRFDGSRGSIAHGGWANYATYAIAGSFASESASDYSAYDHLWFHDIGGKVLESFSILGANGQSHCTASYIWSWDCDGTGGAHPTGTPTGTHATGWKVSHAWSWNCGWQGMSMYGVDDVRVTNCHTWNNAKQGFNAEWATEVDYFDCVAHGNGYAGFGTYGQVENIRYHNPVSYDNVTDPDPEANWRGEFTFLSANHGSVVRNPLSILIDGGTITPNAGIVHVYHDRDTTVTVGRSFAEITIDHPEAASWSLATQQLAIVYRNLPFVERVWPGALANWTNGGLTTTAYIEAGTEGAAPVMLTSPAQYSSRSTGYLLQPGQRYLVQMRLRCPAASAGKTWWLDFQNAAAAVVAPGLQITPIALDTDQWFTVGIIVDVSSADPGRLRWISHSVDANSIIIDWMQVLELGSVNVSDVTGNVTILTR